MTYIRIFYVTTPVSDYLQTERLDYVQAWRQISNATEKLKADLRNFDPILKSANRFVQTMNTTLEKLDSDLFIENMIPKKRRRIVKKMPGELAGDEQIGIDEENHFRLTIYNVIMDNIITCFNERFTEHGAFYGDLECFDPRRFSEMSQSLPEGLLNRICTIIPSLDREKLKEELMTFDHLWPQLSKRDFQEVYKVTDKIDPDFSSENEEEAFVEESVKCTDKQCFSCISCVFQVLCEYNLYSLEFRQLHSVYKFLLTIPLTQVSCERSFSRLKLLKTRLRSCIPQENLEALFLMACEPEITTNISAEVIINKLCQKSTAFKRHLQ